MKKIRKSATKITALLSALLLLTLTACGGKNSQSVNGGNFKFTSYPMQTDVTLKYWVGLNANVSATSESLTKTHFARELMKATGVNVDFIHPSAGQETDQLSILLTSNDLPDIIEYDWYSFPGGPTKALNEEYILKLNDVIKENAPNLSSYLSKNPDRDKMVKTDDGSYYVFPFIRGDDLLLVNNSLVIREDWLKDLGLAIPETMDEWHEVLTKFKTEKKAEAPLSFLSITTPRMMMLTNGEFIGAFGIKKDYFIENGKVVFGAADPRYKAFLTEFAKWYKEGLIDSNIANVDGKIMDTNILTGRTGATSTFAGSGLGRWMETMASKDKTFKLVPAPHVTAVKGQIPEFGQKDLPYQGYGSAAITTSCKNAALAARFLDYGYSEAGSKLFNFGIENESYSMVNGYPKYSDIIMKNPDGLTISQAMGQYIRGNQQGPFIQAKEYVEQYYTLPEQKEALAVWGKSNMDAHLLPKITFTPEESSEVAAIMNDVNTRVDEMSLKFIMGVEPLDNFDKYINDLDRFNLKRAVELYQKAYERYINR